MIIEQSEKQFEDARLVGANVRLENVRLASCSCHAGHPDQRGENDSTRIRTGPGTASRSGSQITLPVIFEIMIGAPEPEKETDEAMLLISCVFEAGYAVRPGFDPTDEQLHAFHSANGIFNCWPFFREFVHSMAVRMGHPPAPVPLLRLDVKRTQPEQARLSKGHTRRAVNTAKSKRPAKQSGSQ